MSNWTSGYVADIDYTYGYYAEMNPLRTRFIMLDNAAVCPEYKTACELGFGQGISTNMHAAATDIEWYGTDFNPAQAGFARELANKCGSGAQLFDQSFKEFCGRKDLPDFDYICLHGIWSWISDENRRTIVDFIRRKLKVGGVLYVSYNTQPGWAAFAPMRHLMTEHAEVIGSTGRGIVSRVDDAINFAENLMATKPVYAIANPHIKDRIDNLKKQNRHYLAHEYFNRDWEPMHFSTLAKWLEPTKLDFACSAHYADQITALNLSQEQVEFLRAIPDPKFAQSVKDFMVNAQFRRDYWVKGKRRLSNYEQRKAILDTRVVLCATRDNMEIKIKGWQSEGSINEAIYDPILDALADNKPKTVGDIIKATSKNKNVGFAEVAQAILILINGEYVAHARTDEQIAAAKKKTAALNSHLLDMARGGTEIACLASPVTGGGVGIAQFQQYFLSRLGEGFKKPEEWAQRTWEIMSETNLKLSVDGRKLATDEENLAELNKQAKEFAELGLPVLRALQIA